MAAATTEQGGTVPPGTTQAPPEPRSAPPLPGLPATLPQFGKHHLGFADFHEQYLSHNIAMADTKASVIFGVAASTLAFFLANGNVRAILLTPEFSVPFVAAIVTMGLIALSASFALLAIWPRLSAGARGIVYFGAVVGHGSAEAYMASVAAHGEAQMAAARLMHCYQLSAVCLEKFEMIRRSLLFGLTGFAACLPILGRL